MRFFLVLVSFGILLPVRSGELEDILAKHYEALGGLENMAKAQSIEIHGTMVRGFRGNQMEAPIKIFVKNRKMVRIETAMRGRAMIRAYDGEKGWLISPRDGDTPMDMEKERAENFAAEADFLVTFTNGKKMDAGWTI